MDTETNGYTNRIDTAQKEMRDLMFTRETPPHFACPDCRDEGWIEIEYPVFADGGWSDARQIRERCACNPVAVEPADLSDGALPAELLATDDLDAWIASQSLPYVDYDRPFADTRYAGI